MKKPALIILSLLVVIQADANVPGKALIEALHNAKGAGAALKRMDKSNPSVVRIDEASVAQIISNGDQSSMIEFHLEKPKSISQNQLPQLVQDTFEIPIATYHVFLEKGSTSFGKEGSIAQRYQQKADDIVWQADTQLMSVDLNGQTLARVFNEVHYPAGNEDKYTFYSYISIDSKKVRIVIGEKADKSAFAVELDSHKLSALVGQNKTVLRVQPLEPDWAIITTAEPSLADPSKLIFKEHTVRISQSSDQPKTGTAVYASMKVLTRDEAKKFLVKRKVFRNQQAEDIVTFDASEVSNTAE